MDGAATLGAVTRSARKRRPGIFRELLSRVLPIAVVGAVMSAGAFVWVFFFVRAAWLTPHTVIEGVAHEPSAVRRSPALARRVTFVIVDGLGLAEAQALAELAPLREEGAFRELISHYPTYTGPNITAMMTGLSPRESGVRLNGEELGARGVDDVAHAAWDAGVWLRIRSRTYPELDPLMRAPRQADVKRGRFQPLFDWEIDRARPRPTAPDGVGTMLEIVYFGDVDEEGHRHGRTSEEYANASARAGRFVERARAELDPETDLLFVVSDHGHRTRGGHGGAEPDVARAFLLAWGRGVRRGAELPPRPMRDVAPTLTLAVGARTPSSNLGAPMLDLFDLDEERAATLLREPFDQAARFSCAAFASPACEQVPSVSAELEQGAGAARAIDTLTALANEREEAAVTAEDAARIRRLAVGLVCALVFIVLARVKRFAWPDDWRGAAAPVALLGTFVVSLYVLGYRPTLSTMTHVEAFMFDATKAVLVSAAVSVALGIKLRWGAREAALLPLATFTVMLPLWAYVGASPRELGPPVASALVFMVSAAVPAAALSGVIVATLAALRLRR